MLDETVEVLQMADVSKVLSLVVTRVHQLLRDRQLIAVRRNGIAAVPELFLDLDEGAVLKGVPGLIAVLTDGGYTDEEILRWLFTEDESLPGRPIDAMHGHLAREVMRRAQAMAF